MGKGLNFYHYDNVQILYVLLPYFRFFTNFHAINRSILSLPGLSHEYELFPQTPWNTNICPSLSRSTFFFPLWSIRCFPKQNMGKWSWIRSINWNTKNFNFHYRIFDLAPPFSCWELRTNPCSPRYWKTSTDGMKDCRSGTSYSKTERVK